MLVDKNMSKKVNRYRDKSLLIEVHEIGRQTAKEFLDEDYEFVIATHLDQDHLHNVRPDRVLSKVD